MTSSPVLRNGLYDIVYKQGAYSLTHKGTEIGSFGSQDRAIQVAQQRYKVRGDWQVISSK